MWLNNTLGWKVGEANDISLWKDDLLGEFILADKFPRVFTNSEH